MESVQWEESVGYLEQQAGEREYCLREGQRPRHWGPMVMVVVVDQFALNLRTYS